MHRVGAVITGRRQHMHVVANTMGQQLVPTPAGAVFNCCACVLGWLAVYCAAALRHQPALDARSLLVRLFRITREDKQLKYREVIYYLQTNK